MLLSVPIVHARRVMDRSRSGAPARTRLDSYVDRYAARTQGMTASEIRALFAVASPARGGLARRRDAEHLRAAARRGRRARSPTWSPSTAPIALQYGSGQGDPRLREQICEVMAPRGHRGAPRRRGRHRRLPAGRRPGHPDLLRPRRRGDLRGAVVRRRARRLQGLPGRRGARRRWTTHGLVPDGAARRRSPPCRRPGGGSSSSTRSRTSTTPPASRCRVARRRRDPRDLPARPTCWCSRTTPTACSASTASRCRALRADEADGRDLPRVVLQDVRPGLPGRLGAGAARRPREARAGPGVRDAVPAVVHPDGGLGVPRHSTTGRARSSSSARCTASAATRWSRRSTT